MPQLTFPVQPDGLCVDVLVNVDAAILVPLNLSGQAPAAVSAKGLIDTGSDATGVSLSILHRLDIPFSHQRTTQGVGGSVPVQLFKVSLHILDSANPTGPWFTHPSILVMGLPAGLSVDVLVGRDVLLDCKMLLDGPARQFTLEF